MLYMVSLILLFFNTGNSREIISTFIIWTRTTGTVLGSKLGTDTNQSSVFNPDHWIPILDLDTVHTQVYDDQNLGNLVFNKNTLHFLLVFFNPDPLTLLNSDLIGFRRSPNFFIYVKVTNILKRLYPGHPKTEVPRLTCPGRESNPGLRGGRRALYRTACLIVFLNLYNGYWIWTN